MWLTQWFFQKILKMDKKIMENGENNMEHDPLAHLSDEELDIIFNRLLQDMVDGDEIENEIK